MVQSNEEERTRRTKRGEKGDKVVVGFYHPYDLFSATGLSLQRGQHVIIPLGHWVVNHAIVAHGAYLFFPLLLTVEICLEIGKRRKKERKKERRISSVLKPI